jgi:hypothetical protein
MGKLTFLLPESLSPAGVRELKRACVAGGPDSMPWLTSTEVKDGQLIVSRKAEESGFVLAPWEVPDAGLLMGATTTLMEREVPYEFEIEMARGKVNQLRCQAEEWRAGGLNVSAEVEEGIRKASVSFGHAALKQGQKQAGKEAREALVSSYRAAHDLASEYICQVFRVRHEQNPALESGLGCRLTALPKPELLPVWGDAFNHLEIPFSWRMIESSEGTFRWDDQDALVDWADEHSFPVTAGPLIDFSSFHLPLWLAGWGHDPERVARVAVDYVVAAMKRYRDRIRRWYLVTAANNASMFSLTEEDLLRLTIGIGQAARDFDPDCELVLGLAQPWGEYLAIEDRAQSPFLFAETLLRADLNLAALGIEIVMGVTPRGSYCRDLLETSRLLDLYALLGVPLRVTVGYPSSPAVDRNADPELTVASGYWRGEASPAPQGEWAASFTSLVLCKPYVQSVHWVHLADDTPHRFPNCGLIDSAGKPKPALESLRSLRQQHLR